MQLIPDWKEICESKESICKIFNLEWNGPGWYFTKTDTLLIVPFGYHQTKDNNQVKIITPENIWDQDWPPSTTFSAYVYNCKFEDTLFSKLGMSPMRKDER